MRSITIAGTEGLQKAAREFLEAVGDNRIIAFYGQMGAGKTTFIKSICEVLGVKDVVTSPTFALVNEYADAEGQPVYHFDFYRIKNLREAYDMGCEEYFYSGYPCFIEWPELVEELLPDDTVKVNIEVLEDESRNVTLS